MNKSELQRHQQQQQLMSEAENALHDVIRRYTDGNYAAALDGMNLALSLTESLGDAFTGTHWPICQGCQPPGSGEVAHPTEQDGRRSTCTTARDRCVGNMYGRMHPEQLRQFIAKVIEERAERAKQNEERAKLDAAPTYGAQADELKPTPLAENASVPEKEETPEEVEEREAAEERAKNRRSRSR